MLQRIVGTQLWELPGIAGVGSGYSAGVVGKINPNWIGGTLSGHMGVTANGTSMVLTILPGWAWVVRDKGISTYDPRALMAESDANDSVTITANSTGSTRNDTVCLKIDQNTAPASDGNNLVSFVALAGATGGGLANAPADGNLYLPLANVAVANAATSISQGNVTDKRMAMRGLWYPYRARAFQTVAQSVPNATATKVTIDTKTGAGYYDPNGNFDVATNRRYYAPISGYYAITGSLAFTTGMSFYPSVYINGAEIQRGVQATTLNIGMVDTIAYMNVGDFAELYAFQQSGTAQNTSVAFSSLVSIMVDFLGN